MSIDRRSAPAFADRGSQDEYPEEVADVCAMTNSDAQIFRQASSYHEQLLQVLPLNCCRRRRQTAVLRFVAERPQETPFRPVFAICPSLTVQSQSECRDRGRRGWCSSVGAQSPQTRCGRVSPPLPPSALYGTQASG